MNTPRTDAVIAHDAGDSSYIAELALFARREMTHEPATGSAAEMGSEFYNGIEWFACWLLDHAEGETIAEEQFRPWACQAWFDHLKKQKLKMRRGHAD